MSSSTFSIRDIHRHQSARFDNHLKYMNPQLPKVLKTLGFDRRYVKGEGAYLWDEQGQRYLDFLSGYGIFNLGRYHPVVVQAARDMLDMQDANLVQFDCPHLLGELAKALIERTQFDGRVYFTSTGAETVETAIKFAKAATKKDRILSFDHAFHGLTVGALSVNGNKEFREGFGTLLHETDRIDFNDLNGLERALKKGDVAAFIFEPIQGKGVYVPEPGFLKKAEELCKKYGALTIADEVQTGLGRTGKFLAIEHEGLKPDMILLSKALSGGLVPTGAVLATHDIFKAVYSKLDRCVVHSSSFGKNSLSAAMGLATLWVIENEKICERAARSGELLMSGIRAMAKDFEMIGEVRGRGCMIGVEFRAPKSMSLKVGWSLLHGLSKDLFPQLIVVPLMQDHRILSQTSGRGQDIVKFLPPLILSDDDIQYFLSSFRDVVANAHRFPGGVWDLGKQLAKASFSDSNQSAYAN